MSKGKRYIERYRSKASPDPKNFYARKLEPTPTTKVCFVTNTYVRVLNNACGNRDLVIGVIQSQELAHRYKVQIIYKSKDLDPPAPKQAFYWNMYSIYGPLMELEPSTVIANRNDLRILSDIEKVLFLETPKGDT